MSRDGALSLPTISGELVSLCNPRADKIHLGDIAHALARTCRFCGHVREFYSVAQHSVYVAAAVWFRMPDPAAALSALLHDAPEAYLGDATWPLKQVPEFAAAFRPLEDRFHVAIAASFDLPLGRIDVELEIERADRAVFLAEVRDLRPDRGGEWAEARRGGTGLVPFPPESARIWPWSSEVADRTFRTRFHTYSTLRHRGWSPADRRLEP